jgi:hypothetical protein
MTATVLAQVAPLGSLRLLADVKALGGEGDERAPALSRLEQALGRDFADRLVVSLSESVESQAPRL